jgi:hypothetical protein
VAGSCERCNEPSRIVRAMSSKRVSGGGGACGVHTEFFSESSKRTDRLVQRHGYRW